MRQVLQNYQADNLRFDFYLLWWYNRCEKIIIWSLTSVYFAELSEDNVNTGAVPEQIKICILFLDFLWDSRRKHDAG